MGTGTPIKVYEALEAGCAVVATPAAAARAVLDGVAAPVRTADGAGAFAGELASLLADEAAAVAQGEEGRAFVVAHADRSVIAGRLASLLLSAVEAG
jgi:mannosyltransferase